MCLLDLPEEVLSMIIDEIMPASTYEQETHRRTIGSQELTWAYDDLRNLRLCCKSLASAPNKHLFHAMYFSLDPETWARCFHVSKRPWLAAQVRRIVYAPAVFDEDLPTLEAYSAFMIHQEAKFQADRQTKGLDPQIYPSWDPKTSSWQEAIKRGYHRYRMKIGFQDWILRCSGVEQGPDVKILARIMTRLPNLDRFAIGMDTWPVSGLRYNFNPRDASRNLSAGSTH